MRPALVLHADWSTDPRKRWVAAAMLTGDGYRLSEPTLAEADHLVENAVRQAKNGSVVLGFDFPIGIPRAYAELAHIDDFLSVLPELGVGHWPRFYDLASRPDEIAVQRPFYPARPGGTAHAHLTGGLGVRDMDDLLRRCDFGDGRRNKACALFWTLGGNQVGRAAISGWRRVLVPAIRTLKGDLGVWPFQGGFAQLMASRSCVITETYPADACVQLGLSAPGRGWSKRNRDDRVARCKMLRHWANDQPIDLQPLTAMLDDGCGADRCGEDRFDAVVGLLGMVGVILGRQPDSTPRDMFVHTVEGWILGQPGSTPSAELSA